MDIWFYSMLAILPFIGLQSFDSIKVSLMSKIRVWSVLILASFIAHSISSPEQSIPIFSYIAIDLIGGLLVIASPHGPYQKSIATLFLMMIFLHISHIIDPSRERMYLEIMHGFGWLQLIILAFWSVKDGGRAIINCIRNSVSNNIIQKNTKAS